MGDLMNNDGLRFLPGDTVCYTGRHYEWLKLVARWPSIHIPRTGIKGTVVVATEAKVTVNWGNGSAPLVHLPGNLELMEDS